MNNLIENIFGYKVANTALYKELSPLVQTFSYSKIAAYLKDKEDYLTMTMKKSFQSEYAKIRYFSAILKNNLADYAFNVPEESPVKQIEHEVVPVRYKRKVKRRGLAEFECGIGEIYE